MRRTVYGLLIVLAAASAARAEDAPGVALEVVRYPELVRAVQGLKGKVVLVDFWFEACLPCKREFPKLVALQEKYRARGLAAVSVNLDDPGQEGVKESVREFLRAQKATCRNLMLDEKPEVWQAKLKIEVLPCVFLFDRDGRLLARWDDDAVDYEAIERRVRKALGDGQTP
ncbi:MAG TPA: TlpA disulfide reductase family protein [Gemmataceae bacterium]